MSHTEKKRVTYYSGHVVEVGGKRYALERTCRMVDNGCELCCSECDGRHEYDEEPNYCSYCGARVEEVR